MAQSFSSSTMIATSSPTLTSVAPAGTRIFATYPSSIDSSAIVALSVSMSAMTSPALTLSPAAIFHSAMLPWVIVGDSAGIVISWYGGSARGEAVGTTVRVESLKKGAPRNAGETRKMEISPLGTRADGPSPRVCEAGSRVSESISARVGGTHSQRRRRTTRNTIGTRPPARRLCSGRRARFAAPAGRFRLRLRRAVRPSSRSRSPPRRPRWPLA